MNRERKEALALSALLVRHLGGEVQDMPRELRLLADRLEGLRGRRDVQLDMRAYPPARLDDVSFFMLNDLVGVFSGERQAAGGAVYKLAPTDYRRAESACEWAREHDDPVEACRESMRAYFRKADDMPRRKGWPFWGWANDPGAWTTELGESLGKDERAELEAEVRRLAREADGDDHFHGRGKSPLWAKVGELKARLERAS